MSPPTARLTPIARRERAQPTAAGRPTHRADRQFLHPRRFGGIFRVVEQVKLHMIVGALNDGLDIDAHVHRRVAGFVGDGVHLLD